MASGAFARQGAVGAAAHQALDHAELGAPHLDASGRQAVVLQALEHLVRLARGVVEAPAQHASLSTSHLADQARLALEVDHAVAFGAAHEFGRVLARGALDQDALHRALAAGADGAHVVVDGGLQVLQARELDFVRRVVVQRRGRRAGARAEDEAEAGVVADLVDQLHHLVEVVFGLAGEADDEVAAHGQVGADGAQLAHRALVFHGGVAALHRHQDAVAAVLHRQVQVAHQLGHLGVGVDQALRELVGVAGGVADALDAGDLGHVLEQQREVGDLGRAAHGAAVGVDVLAQQRDFLARPGRPGRRLDQHVVKAAARPSSPRV
jgi:hypothetical protein